MRSSSHRVIQRMRVPRKSFTCLSLLTNHHGFLSHDGLFRRVDAGGAGGGGTMGAGVGTYGVNATCDAWNANLPVARRSCFLGPRP